MIAIFDHSDSETDTIKTFWFKPSVALPSTAGQFTELTLRHEHPDSRGEKRYFTLSSGPGHDLVSITTKYAGDEHASSFKKALFHLQPGNTIEMSEPMGEFVLPEDPKVPLVFVAGGIGLTPFHSMLTWLIDHGEHRPIHFLYSVHSENEIIFQDTFNRANIHATIVVEDPSDTWGGERGRITAEEILGLSHPTAESLFYLSGPEPMIKALANGLLNTGIPNRRLITDFFPGYTSI